MKSSGSTLIEQLTQDLVELGLSNPITQPEVNTKLKTLFLGIYTGESSVNFFKNNGASPALLKTLKRMKKPVIVGSQVLGNSEDFSVHINEFQQIAKSCKASLETLRGGYFIKIRNHG